MAAQKSTGLAYFLWLVGGLFGLHHFYLRRDRHAFVMFTTAGCFGVGWLTDLWKIPEYVCDANEDSKYLEKVDRMMKQNQMPYLNFAQQFGAIITGFAWGCVCVVAIPEERFLGIELSFLHYFSPVAIALGVHTVGNIGRVQGGLFWPLLGAYSHLMFKIIGCDCMICAAFISFFLFEWKALQWRRTPKQHKSSCNRACILGAFAALYAAFWASFFYYNLEVKVTVKDDIVDVVKFRVLMNSLWEHGWKALTIPDIHNGLDEALKMLDLGRNVTQEDITTRWRTLSKTWHPDRFADEQAKKEAEEIFLRISSAYQTLSQIMKAHRLQNNASSFQDVLTGRSK